MRARITISLTVTGELDIYLNEEGRDLLVRELLRLGERNDHFHFGPDDTTEIEVRSIGYRPDDKVLEYGKILFRPDAWDRQHFPHVLTEEM